MNRLILLFGFVFVVGQIPTYALVERASLRPTSFILNVGQWPSHVVAAGRSGDVDVFVTRSGMVVNRHELDAKSDMGGHVVALYLEDVSSSSKLQTGAVTGLARFIHGQNPKAWYEAPMVESLRLDGIQSGVDILWRFDEGQIRFDLHLASGVHPSSVRMSVHGADTFEASEENGIHMPLVGIGLKGLRVFQNGLPLHATFNAHGSKTAIVEVQVPFFNENAPLVIDPIVHGTYLGTGNDTYAGIKRLPNGDVAVAGTTSDLAFPSGTGGYKADKGSGKEAFVAILDGKLMQVKAYTFIGGSGDEAARAIDADETGAIYLTGTTNSNNFPLSPGAARQLYSSLLDAFVVKLTPNAAGLAVGTYVGGNLDDIPNAITFDVDKNIYIVGETRSSTGFPTNNGFQRTAGGQLDAFLTKISTTGSQFIYSTFLGRANDDAFTALAVDATGAPYCVGYTKNSNWQTAPTPSGMGQQQRRPYDRTFNGGNTDAVVVKFGIDGGGMQYSTYWGGSADEEARGVFVDEQGRCHVVMVTTSTNLDDILGFSQQSSGGKEIVLGTFSKDGRDMSGATYFGGSMDDEAMSVNVDAAGNALIGGVTNSMDFPLKGAGSEDSRLGPTDGFVSIITSGAIRSSNLIVGNDADVVVGVSGDPKGDVYFLALTMSNSFRPGSDAYDNTFRGPATAYIGKLAFGTVLLSSPAGGETWCAGTTQTISWGTNEMLSDDSYTVEVSGDAGATWTAIASDITTTSYAWRIQNVTGEQYLVRVRSGRGHLVETSTPIAISTPPTIVTQPMPVADCAGRPATLTVVSNSEGNRYQWRRNGSAIQGATTSRYEIPVLSAATEGRYDCVVNGACNPSATSTAVDVRIVNAPVLSLQPMSTSVDKGQRLTLRVEGLGTGLRYQWQRNGSPIDGATSATFEIEAVVETDGGEYTCVVTSDCGSTTSSPASVVVDEGTSVTEFETLSGVFVLGPIPAADVLSLQLPDSFSEFGVRVFTMSGLTVLTTKGMPGRLNVNVASLAASVYIIEVTGGGQVFRVPVVVAR